MDQQQTDHLEKRVGAVEAGQHELAAMMERLAAQVLELTRQHEETATHGRNLAALVAKALGGGPLRRSGN